MKPPRWWNLRVAALLLILGALALLVVAIVYANNYANAHWGPV